MKIQTALVSAFLAISLVIGIISISGIASIHNTIMDISKHEIPRMQNIMHMKTFLKDASKNIADYVKSDDLQERNEFYANTGAFNTLLNIYSDMNGTSREVELLNKLELEFPIFQQSGNELILIQDSQREQVVQLNLVNDNIVSTIGSLQKNLEPSAQNFTQKLTALIRMENSIREVVSSSQSYLIQQDTVLKERVKKGIDNFERSQKEFLANSLTREENVNTTLIKKYFDTIQSASSDLITLEDKKQAMLERFELSERSIGNIFDELELVINDRINQEQKTAIDTADMALIAVVTSVPSAIVLGLVMSSSISKPIRKLRENLKEMADGNLDIKVKLQGNEEVLALCESINSMVNKLKTHDKLQKEFISIASHELRSPIQPILSFADLANKGHISNEQAWSSVLTQARRLQRLANDILYVTRIESGELTYNMKRVPIDEIIVEAMTAEKANLNEGVSMDAQLNANVEIYADRNRLGQALTNVIGNAVKFTKKGYVRVESRLLPGKSKIEIKVSDTAGGIPEDILPKLFEKFVTKNIGNENQHGTGLGLFISKAIITAHRGEITVYNNNGGATFVIVLPVK